MNRAPCAVYSLSIHARYRCGHSGACCTSGWPIPVERETARRLRGLAAARRFDVPGDPDGGAGGARVRTRLPLVRLKGAPAETPVVAAVRANGACAFYERDSGLCAIHRQAGADLLPVACRQFPRISLLDRRGLFVNLSHCCPTAASLLWDGGPVEIVKSPEAFPPDFPYDPLDARDAVPPLLRPGVLLDLSTFSRWERKVVRMLARGPVTSAEEALGRVKDFTEALRAWHPATSDLASHFDESRRRARSESPAPRDAPAFRRRLAASPPGESALDHYTLVFGAIPPDCRPIDSFDRLEESYDKWVRPCWTALQWPVRRYLATRAFGSWLAYQGWGLRTIVYSLEVALSLVWIHAAMACGDARSILGRDTLTQAIRRTDELMLHLASRDRLASALSAVEKLDAPLSSDVR